MPMRIMAMPPSVKADSCSPRMKIPEKVERIAEMPPESGIALLASTDFRNIKKSEKPIRRTQGRRKFRGPDKAN